jgi:hypothetical protein
MDETPAEQTTDSTTGQDSLFRKESLEQIKSPEQFDQYIKVSNQSIWLVIGAILLLIIGGGIWIMSAQIPVSVNLIGISTGNDVLCFITNEEMKILTVGQNVTVTSDLGETTGIITAISYESRSLQQLSEIYSELAMAYLAQGDFSYHIRVAADLPKGRLVLVETNSTMNLLNYMLNT